MTSWQEQNINRKIEWTLEHDTFVYRVVGERTNFNGNILKPECKPVVLMQGKRVFTNWPIAPGSDALDSLKRLADTWQAHISIPLSDGSVEAYNGGMEAVMGPINKDGPATDYPYFPA